MDIATLHKYRKILWAAAVIVIVIHYAPRFIKPRRQAVFAPPPLQQPAPPQKPPAPDASLAKMIGQWSGSIASPGRKAMCGLTLKIDASPNQENPGRFSGYSTLKCGPNEFEMMMSAMQKQKNPDPAALFDLTRQYYNATSAILTGSPEAGSIRFHVDKNIGVSETPGGCNMTSLTATPFGQGQIAVEWREEPPCQGGQVVMQRN